MREAQLWTLRKRRVTGESISGEEETLERKRRRTRYREDKWEYSKRAREQSIYKRRKPLDGISVIDSLRRERHRSTRLLESSN